MDIGNKAVPVVAPRYKISISDMIKLVSTLLVVITAVTFFIYKMQDLPPRVDKLEKEMSTTRAEFNELKNELNKSSVKQDIIIDDLKLLKSHLLNK